MNFEEQYARLLTQKNERNAVLLDERKMQLENKMNKLKSKLEFKNFNCQDAKFRENVKQTLNDVKDC